jgi:GTP-binding protein
LKVLSAEFVTSAAAGGSAAVAPREALPSFDRQVKAAMRGFDGPRVAMAGRSNVGKSTLINALGRKKIARTSAAPGKTRLANIYRLTLDGGPGKWNLYLVDLPGYGYARGGADAAAELRAVAEAYFSAAAPAARGGADEGISHRGHAGRPASPLMRSAGGAGALLLIDSRHPGLESDYQAAHWLESMHVEYRVVATKIDKLTRTERARNLEALERSFGMPPVAVSATSGEGLDALWKTIVSLARTGPA